MATIVDTKYGKELQLVVNVKIPVQGHIQTFINHYYFQQDLFKGYTDTGDKLYRYPIFQISQDTTSATSTYDESYLTDLITITSKLLELHGISPDHLDNILFLCGMYSYFEEIQSRKKVGRKDKLTNAKLLTKLLKIPFPTVTIHNIFDFAHDDDHVLGALCLIKKSKREAFETDGTLDLKLIDDDLWPLLTKKLIAIEIEFEINNPGRYVSQLETSRSLFFSPYIKANLISTTDHGTASIPLIDQHSDKMVRLFLSDLIASEKRENTEFFRIVSQQSFNAKGYNKLNKFINSRIGSSHNSILREISLLISDYLHLNKLMFKPQRGGEISTDMKVFIYSLFSLLGLVLIKGKFQHTITSDTLLDTFNHVQNTANKSKIISQFSEIIKKVAE
ncbi:MAG: hypothetical protein Q8S11_17885 [Daejeonella sp.]|uniref:hypothetical protein n=1 Tax=Daejeonella sp. TaxID=2805397 RepID=UPI0027363C7B|nr:hypothetical protein [Daejeonella sp.]MDP3470217.1 hypothetical protein [Daejeonella sp.]